MPEEIPPVESYPYRVAIPPELLDLMDRPAIAAFSRSDVKVPTCHNHLERGQTPI
jgi:hypothetical protein